jgi:hypothetical protein|nr:MAG TPA: hypothetical protein [Caudoviricetes sp.]
MYTIDELRKVSATPGHLKVLDKLTEWGYDELIDDFMWEWELWVCPRYWAVQYCQKAADRYLPCGEELYDHMGEGIDDSLVGDLLTDPVSALMLRAEWVLDTHCETVLELEAFRAIPTDLSLKETITKLRAIPGVERSPLVYLLDDMEATQC